MVDVQAAGTRGRSPHSIPPHSISPPTVMLLLMLPIDYFMMNGEVTKAASLVCPMLVPLVQSAVLVQEAVDLFLEALNEHWYALAVSCSESPLALTLKVLQN
jgi:hypothetical protein